MCLFSLGWNHNTSFAGGDYISLSGSLQLHLFFVREALSVCSISSTHSQPILHFGLVTTRTLAQCLSAGK